MSEAIIRQLNGALMNSMGQDFQIRADFVREIIAELKFGMDAIDTLRRTTPPSATGDMVHQGECATDESAKQVCEGMYTDKVDEVFALVEALEAIATLNAGTDEQSREVRGIALKAIAEQRTSIDSACEARTELATMILAAPSPRVEAEATTSSAMWRFVLRRLKEHGKVEISLADNGNLSITPGPAFDLGLGMKPEQRG